MAAGKVTGVVVVVTGRPETEQTKHLSICPQLSELQEKNMQTNTQGDFIFFKNL